MKEVNYNCTHLDFNKSYGCSQCEEEKKNEGGDTNSAAAKTMRKG